MCVAGSVTMQGNASDMLRAAVVTSMILRDAVPDPGVQLRVQGHHQEHVPAVQCTGERLPVLIDVQPERLLACLS